MGIWTFRNHGCFVPKRLVSKTNTRLYRTVSLLPKLKQFPFCFPEAGDHVRAASYFISKLKLLCTTRMAIIAQQHETKKSVTDTRNSEGDI